MTEITTPLLQDANAIHQRVAAEFAGLHQSPRSLQEKIALSCRHLADEGHASTLAGQVSVRVGDGSFWTTNVASGLADARPSNLVRVDGDLRVLEGKGMANPATRFHLWIYARRPDIHSIVHTHSPHASALAITGRQLQVAHMDMMMFYDDCAYLADWPGVPFANEEGRLISEALGDKHSILLANHGFLTAGETLEHAIYLAVHFELAAKIQLLADASGLPTRAVGRELALQARSMATSAKFINANFAYWLRLAERRHPDALS